MVYRREDGNIGWVEPHDDWHHLQCHGHGATSRRVTSIDHAACRIPRFRRDQDRAFRRQQALAAPAARESGGQRLGIVPAAILATVTEREQLGSTGFGQGVAIPHGKIED